MQTLYGTLLQPRSPRECPVTPRSIVSIRDDGRFGALNTGAAPADATGDEQCWILPGFIDAHLHLPQWDRRGIDGMTLSLWRERVGYPAEARLRDPAAARNLAEMAVSGLIAQGTTTIAAFGSSFASEVEASFEVFARRGLRAIYGMTLNDRHVAAEIEQSADSALDDARKLASKWHNAEKGRLRYAFGPRGSVQCSEAMLRGAAALANMFGCYLQTHVAESSEELAAVHENYPEQVDEIDVFSEMGLLTERTLLAHGLFLSQQQRRQVAAKGAALVHCPTGNLFRESGLMDYVAHRGAGLRIALGSSIAGGPDPFMPRVAVEALYMAKAIKVHTLPRRAVQVPTPAEAWWLLTRGGAEALGLAQSVGSIEAGYEADCLVVRPEPWIAELPPERQVSALLYTLRPDQIQHVFIGGRRVGP